MKKTLLLISFVAILSAKSFSQITAQSTNDTAWDVSTTNTVILDIPIYNTGNTDLSIRVIRTVNNLAGVHKSLFCFGTSCYGEPVDTSSIFIFAAGDTQILSSDLHPHSDIGTSYVTYRIYDVNDPQNFVDVNSTFIITATGINENQNPIISHPQPNPADGFTSLTYNINGDAGICSIKIINMLGKTVREIKLDRKQGVILIPTSDLQSGVYFYSLEQNGKVLSTDKLIVSHQN